MKLLYSKLHPGGFHLLRVALAAMFCAASGLSADRLAVGNGHILVVGESGNLWTWGANASGQLGTGSTAASADPVRVGTSTQWTAVAAGGQHSLALRADGTLWAWGGNANGQLGINSTVASVNQPTRVGNQSNWVAIAARDNTSLALRADGSLWGWGANGSAQLGRLTSMLPQSSTPVRIGDGTFTAIALGQNHVLAIGTDGRLYGWGSNAVGQIGIVEAPGTLPLPNPLPRVVGSKTDWVSVAAGGLVSFAIDASGNLFSWGVGLNLGLGAGVSSASVPTRVTGSWSSVAAGDQHALALTQDGRLFGWGLNTRGQLGQMLTRPDGQPTFAVEFPLPVELTSGEFAAIAAGQAFSSLLTAGGTVYTAGSNENGLLGIGPTALTQRDSFQPSNFGIPNLALVGIEILTEAPALGQPLNVRLEIENRGSGRLAAGQAVPIAFALSSTGEPDEEAFVHTNISPAPVLNDVIGAGQTIQRTFSVVLRQDVPDGTYFLVVEVNPDGTLNEPTLGDNRLVSTDALVFMPDITGSIAFSSVVRNRGQSFNVEVTFRNEGNSVIPAGLEATIVAIDRDSARVSVAPVEIGRLALPSNLLPGAALGVTAQVVVPALLNPSIYNLGVVFDPEGTLEEPNVENNFRFNNVQTLSIPPVGNPTLLFALGATATGFTPAIDAQTLLTRFGGAGAWYAGGTVGSSDTLFAQAPVYIEDGEEAYFEIQVPGPFRIQFDWAIASEDDRIRFTVDGAPPQDDLSRPSISATQELVTYEAIISAGPAPRRLRWTYERGSGPPASVALINNLELVGVDTPDLVVTDLSYNSPGQEVFIPRRFNEYLDVVVTGINAGRPMPTSSNPASNLFEVEVRLTKDKVWGGPDDVVLGVLEEIENLDSGGRFLYGRLFDLDYCIPEGEYYLAVFVDSTQRYEEFNERNNIAFSENRDIIIEHRPQLEVRNLQYRAGIYYRRSEVPMTFDLHNSGCADLLPGEGGYVRIRLTAESQIRRFGQGSIRLDTTVLDGFSRELAEFFEFNGVLSDTSVPFKASLQIPWYNEPQVWRTWFASSTPTDNQLLPKFPGFGLSLPVADDELPGVGPYTGGVMGIARNSVVVGGSVAGGDFLFDFVELDPDDFLPSTNLNSSYLERMFTARHPIFFGFEFLFQSASDGVDFIYDTMVQQFSRNIFIAATPLQQRYEDWQFFWDLPIHRPFGSGSIGGPFENPDGDGYPNLIEWAFAQNPRVPDLEGKPTVGLIELNRPAGSPEPGDFFTQITFNALSDYSNRNLTYVVEAADDLAFTDPIILLIIEPGDDANFIRSNTIDHADEEGNPITSANVMAVMDHHYSYRVTVRDIVRVEANGQRFVRVTVINGE